MRYRNPTPVVHEEPLFEYEPAAPSVHILRPLEFEVWAAIRPLNVLDICKDVLHRRFPHKRPGPIADLAAKTASCVRQADEYYQAAVASSPRIAPVLHYYSMLNLAKALIYLRAPDRLQNERDFLHGLSDPIRLKDAAQFSLARERVLVRDGIFRSLCAVLAGSSPAAGTAYDIGSLLPYCVWISMEQEDLFRTRMKLVRASFRLAFNENLTAVHVLATLLRSDVDSKAGGQGRLAKEIPHLLSAFERVSSDEDGELEFESRPLAYAGSIALRSARRQARQILSSLPLYRCFDHSDGRGHYLLALGENPLPEASCLYAITFFLGSLVRYQPHVYDKMLGTDEAYLLESFISQCPLAYAYVMLNHLWEEEHIFQTL